ncbi:MAG: S41 family peptidase [Patescibacteria group bacterium]
MFWKKDSFKLRYRAPNFFVKNIGLLLSITVLLATFFIGFYVGKKVEYSKTNSANIQNLVNKDAKPGFALDKEVDFNLFWSIWNRVKQDYVKQPVDEVKMFYGAISGMVASLGDPYSIFLEPKIAEEFQQELAGEFEGIGAEIGIKNNALTIVAPLLDSPSEKAGIKAGDVILTIDGKDTTGLALDEAVQMIRGKKGTKVKLLINREGFKAPQEFQVTRDKIVVKSVQWSMQGDYAYIKVLQFGNDTARDFNKVIGSVILKNPKGIILDLRNNPGGYLDAAIEMAGEWIPDDIVVYEKYKDQQEGFRAHGKGRLKDYKTIVLINKGSASGSEIVAGALQDYNKAILVGEKSFGKGSVQDYKEYGDGSALKMTIALWLTPNGNSINGQGIEPNFKVEITEKDAAAGADPQLEKAKELL